MRINKPQTLVGYGPTETYDQNLKKLATIGQVKSEINKIDRKFEMLLRGAPGSTSNGLGGLSNLHGYAWLNAEGKIDPSLLPALAITETHVIPVSSLQLPENAGPNDIYVVLNDWIKSVLSSEAPHPTFQKGDIIIVVAGTPSNSETTAGIDNASDASSNASALGSYIITYVPPADSIEKYLFAKISYTSADALNLAAEVASLRADLNALIERLGQ